MCRERKPWTDFVGYDLFGYEYNCQYPPDRKRYGSEFGGYATPNREVFFYYFCILQYGVAFYYRGIRYEAEFHGKNGPTLKSYDTGERLGPFPDAMKLLRQAVVGGDVLIDVIDELEEVVLH